MGRDSNGLKIFKWLYYTRTQGHIEIEFIIETSIHITDAL